MASPRGLFLALGLANAYSESRQEGHLASATCGVHDSLCLLPYLFRLFLRTPACSPCRLLTRSHRHCNIRLFQSWPDVSTSLGRSHCKASTCRRRLMYLLRLLLSFLAQFSNHQHSGLLVICYGPNNSIKPTWLRHAAYFWR